MNRKKSFRKNEVRVRFAPSPTGHLHIGGLRTALYCHLYAKAHGGTFILRIEDTDRARGGREYETSLIDALAWAGLTHDEGPYRQSERVSIYREKAWKLVEEGMAYPCFLTAKELEALTERATNEEKAPHFYHNQCASLSPEQSRERIRSGQKHAIRFKNPGKTQKLTDCVRGEVQWEADTVGDFVIMRSDGMPVYNFCCVIDDILMGISHVIRAEDHLNNTLRQLMVYDALGETPPTFAHCSLILDKERKKLSKRQGAASLSWYREKNYLPSALLNYLCLLGWSHPEDKDIFLTPTLGKQFSLTRFSKSAATYDDVKLRYVNGQHIQMLNDEELVNYMSQSISRESPFHQQTETYKKKACRLFAPRVNLPHEMNNHLKYLFENHRDDSEELTTIMGHGTTTKIKDYLKGEIAKIQEPFVEQECLNTWMGHLKREGIKGRSLFMGMRAVLTGQVHGADLKTLVSLIPTKNLKTRLKG